MTTVKTRLFPRLVGGPQGDPALFVDVEGARRSLLVDCGDLSGLGVSSLQRVTDCLVTHTHIDHFYGFDRLLRVNIPTRRTIRVAGPEGVIDQVGGKLSGYHWNLSEDLGLEFHVTQVAEEAFQEQTFRVQDRFRPAGPVRVVPSREFLIEDPDLTVRWAILDHGIPSIAYRVTEPDFHNVDESRLAEAGLAPGRWLRELKEAVIRGEDPGRTIDTPAGPRPLADLSLELIVRTPGRSICYAADTVFSERTRQALVQLAWRADQFFCEHHYLEKDRDLAAKNRHLTASQAGRLAREAGVTELIGFHFSAKYADSYPLLVQEGQAAFREGG